MPYSFSGISLSRSVRIKQNQLKVDRKAAFSFATESTDEWCTECYKHLNIPYPKFYKMDTMSKLGILATEYLLADMDISEVNEYKRCMIFQNTESSLATDRNYAETLKTIPSPALFVYTLPNIVMGEIAIKHKLKGENTFFVSSVFNAAPLMEYAQLLFQGHVAELVILGFIDFSSSDQDVLLCLLSKSKEGQSSLDLEQIDAIYNA